MKYFNFLIILTLLLLTTNSFALTDANLVSWWNLDETSGTNMADKMGANAGTLDTNSLVNQTGVLLKAVRMLRNSATDLNIANETNFDFITAKSPTFSVSMWYKGDTTTTMDILWSKWATNNGVKVDVRTNGQIFVGHYYSTSAGEYWYASTGNTNLLNGNWHHIVITASASETFLVYIDGILTATTKTGSGPATTPNNSAIFMFGNSVGQNVPLRGYIDELNIWNTALSATDVNVLRNNGLGVTYCPGDANEFVETCAAPGTKSKITWNVYRQGTTSHLTNVTIDCNIAAWDASGQNSPFDSSLVDTNTAFDCNFTRTGYDANNGITGVVDSNKTITVTLNDSTAPSVGTTTINGFTTYSNYIKGTGTIYAPATDLGSGINTCEYTDNNGSNWYSADSNATGCYKTLTIADQNYTFNLRATDVSGNTGTGTATSTYIGDITAPIPAFSSYQIPATTDQNILLTCTDAKSGCKNISYSIDSTTWINLIDFNVNDYNYSATEYQSTQTAYKAYATYYLPRFTQDRNSTINHNYVTSITDQIKETSTGTASVKYKLYFTDGTDEFTSENTSTSSSYTAKTYTVTTQNKDVNYIELWMAHSSNATATYAKDTNIIFITNSDYNENYYWTLFNGTGLHTIDYYALDNVDNNSGINSDSFTTYGKITFNFYDENTSSTLTDVYVDYNGTPVLSTGNVYSLNLQGIVQEKKTFTIYKSGYTTRFYQVDLNENTDVDINFALLPTGQDLNILFRFYKPDETTAYSNVYVQVKDRDTNFVLGRLETDSTGLVSFDLDQNATGLQFDMNEGENTYNSVLLTINRPKNEQTLVDIPGNWNYQISSLASFIDMNVSTNTKVLAIYSNTVASYTITVGSNSTSPVYVSRKYDVQVLGDVNTYTLQPYLFDSALSITTTLYTINAYTNQAVGDIGIKIYRNLPIVGKTLIEQTLTDAKGQSLVYLILNQTYQFELTINGAVIRTETYTISGTSSSIYFKIDPGYSLDTSTTQLSVFPFFSPGKSYLSSSDANVTANVSYGSNKNSVTVSAITIACYNDTNLLFQDNFGSPAMNFTQTYDFNITTKQFNSVAFDGNYPITCVMRVTLSDGNILNAQQSWNVNNNLPQQVLGMSLRPFFGCTATNDPNVPCPMMIVAALFITMMGVAGIMIESGFTYPEFAGILFLISLGFFAFFQWIPPILYAIILIISLFIYVALGVRRI